MNILDSVKYRYSTVLFSSKPVDNEKLELLFEAARWAPSAYNEQPWRFIIGIKEKNENYDKLLKCLVDGNKYWAKNAPVLVLIIAKTLLDRNQKINSTSFYDTGMAVGNLLNQATSLNLIGHQMGGFNKDMAKQELQIPAFFEPISIMAIGYKGNTEDFPDDLQFREKKTRTRKSLDELFNLI